MSVPMFDCRNLIEFCRSFHHTPTNPRRTTTTETTTNNSCHRSPFAAIDIILLLSVLLSLTYLTISYSQTFFRHVLPTLHNYITNLLFDAPLACSMSVLGFVFSIVVWEMIDFRVRRKCKNRDCKGLRRAVEYDIQLEPEECITGERGGSDEDGLELGNKEKDELKAELKKMAPVNGRTVLVFRARCGCPIARLEVWGPKKVRRIKK